jgi:phosphatidylglycerol:prolipoprotein diacylglycerol transferase
MIIHNFDPVFIDFGIFQIRWYSLSYIFGIIFGWLYAIQIIKKMPKNNDQVKLEIAQFGDLIFYIILGIIIGGRLGYIFFYNFDFYSQNVFEMFKIWNGGMSFHGGLVGLVIATFIFSKISKTSFFHFTDLIACVAPIGIFLGRVANFINGELYGKTSTLPWAIIFPEGGNVPRHPSQIYEAILEGLILFLIIRFFAIKKRLLLKRGQISATFLILYSIFRIFSESFRMPDEQVGYFFNYFSMGVLLSIVTLLAGFLIVFFNKKNEQDN